MDLINEVLQTILSGVSIGCVYGLVALGFVLIFKATEVINFAQGELLMLGAFISYSLITFLHFPYWAALLATIILMGFFGMALERTVLRSLVGEPVYAIVIVTIGISFFIRSAVSMIPGWGTDTHGFQTPFTEKFVRPGQLVISWEYLSIILITTALIMVLFSFFRYTRVGTAMRATSQNQLAVHKLKMIAAESYKRGDTEFSSQIAKLKKAEVQLVVLATVIRETVGALKEAKKINWNVDMVGMSPTFNHVVLELCLKAGFSPDGYYATNDRPYIYPDSPIATVRAFCKKHKEWFGKDPDMPTTAGYIGIDFFAKVAAKVGKDLTREKWVDAAEHYGVFKDEYFGSVDVHFTTTNHQGSFGAIMTQVQGNKFVKIADVSYK